MKLVVELDARQAREVAQEIREAMQRLARAESLVLAMLETDDRIRAIADADRRPVLPTP